MTSRHGHAPIQMRRRLPDMTEGWADRVPWTNDWKGGARVKRFPGSLEQVGDFYWDLRGGERRAIVIAIPTGTGWESSRWTIDYPNHSGGQWSWDGNEDSPTLTPSIHAVGIWHGRVSNGELIEA